MKEGSLGQVIKLSEYKKPDFLITHTDLVFDLTDEGAVVSSTLKIRRNDNVQADVPLVLNGQELLLLSVELNGAPLSDSEFQQSDEYLTISDVPDEFDLSISVKILPQNNSSLEGLYRSGNIFCTQCEAEGFRKITYYLDRPDVLATFTTTIIADKAAYPCLLSNGNMVESKDIDASRHSATWADPFPKPCYLFALVAGDLDKLSNSFKTCSGRDVRLEIFVDKGNLDKCDHAMQSLKNAMAWDEKRFDLEYDLDIYMIVAVDAFNMGAMENKGLNVFNAKYVLAKPETATDTDFDGIESVIGHEYFHNWTGNRVTCRDWFQLSLKEGLTVFRDQEFSSDLGTRAVQRIDDVNLLRMYQFPEDAGPMSHPVRPPEYEEINNFYTSTVYNKGAEVIRMMHTLLGEANFQKGIKLYFERHDGQAVTTDDFVAAMEDASQIDLEHFRLWYSQSGTPIVKAAGVYDSEKETYTLTLEQSTPPTPNQNEKQPLHIPVNIGLIDDEGSEVKPVLLGEDTAANTPLVLDLKEQVQRFEFKNIKRPVVPSLFRGFSAPVKLEIDISDADYANLLVYETDAFNQWEAAQQLASRVILEMVDNERVEETEKLQLFGNAVEAYLTRSSLVPALAARIVNLPAESEIAEKLDTYHVDLVHESVEFVADYLSRTLLPVWHSLYQQYHNAGEYKLTQAEKGARALKNACLSYLARAGEGVELASKQFYQANNMTDAISAFKQIVEHAGQEVKQTAVDDFYNRWKDDALVLDKWLSVQANSSNPATLETVKALTQHEAFNIKNPNKVRSLIGVFARNAAQFNQKSGDGYRFVADKIIELNGFNPQVASRLMNVFGRWRKLDAERQALVQVELKRIIDTENLSKDVYEIVHKTLGC